MSGEIHQTQEAIKTEQCQQLREVQHAFRHRQGNQVQWEDCPYVVGQHTSMQISICNSLADHDGVVVVKESDYETLQQYVNQETGIEGIVEHIQPGQHSTITIPF